MKPLSQRVAQIPASGIRRFFDLVSEMEDVISLGVGEPDFVTPLSVRQAAIRSLEQGRTAYTSNYGLLELREAIARMTHVRTGASYNPKNEILVTVGVSEALDTAFRAILNPGDEVVVPQPCYVSYLPCVEFAGGTAVSIDTTADNGFRVTPEEVERVITSRTKAILLSYPSNPTGATLDAESVRNIAEIAARHDLYILSDEIYDRLAYDAPHASFAAVPEIRDRLILLNGFSKAYAMTGWRIGYACAPAPVLEMMMKIHQYTMLCAPTIGQIGALEALRSGEPDTILMAQDYDRRRQFFVRGLNELGLSCPMPGGAFYAFPSVARTGLSSEEFTERLLTQERVLVVPGDVFGASGAGHVRCCYATAMEKLDEALVRIGRFLKTL